MITDLTKGNPAKAIIIFAIPIIIGNLFQQVYNLVDTIIVGRFVCYEALAGVGATNGLGFLVLNFALGITSGLGILIAQFFGAADREKVKKSIGTSLLICAATSVFLTLVALLFTQKVLVLTNTPESILGYAHDYIYIIFAGITAQVAFNMAACILRALGDSRTPLLFLIVSSVLNIVLDLVFIAGFGWGVKGAAWATVISQVVSAVLCFLYANRKYELVRLDAESFRTSLSFIWKHLRVGLPMALQFSITGVGLILLQMALNDFPDTYIAGFTAANKVQNLGALTGVSLGVAVANYVGQNFGAGNISRCRQGVRASALMSLGVCLVVGTLMAMFADPLTGMFVKDAEPGQMAQILFASRKYMYMSALFFPFLYLLIILRNALQGIGKAFWPLMTGVLELVIRAAVAFTLPERIGYTGITLIDISAWIGAYFMLYIAYYIQMPKNNDTESN